MQLQTLMMAVCGASLTRHDRTKILAVVAALGVSTTRVHATSPCIGSLLDITHGVHVGHTTTYTTRDTSPDPYTHSITTCPVMVP